MKQILILFLILIVLCSCQEKTEQPDLEVDLTKEQAKYFAGYTAEIKMNQPIILRFTKKIPFPVGIHLGAIKLQPEIMSKAQVKNEYEVEIVPIRQFKQSFYVVNIDMNSLFKADIPPLSLPVKIKERELIKLDTHFEMNDELRKFKAAFAFDDDTISISNLKQAMSLKLDKKEITFSLKKDEFDSHTWLLQSEEFIPGNAQEIVITFHKEPLLLKDDIERSFLLPERIDLILQTSYYEKVNDKYVILLSFSENLDFEQDLSKFIEVKEIETFELAKSQNKIHIQGDFITNKPYTITVKKGIRSAQGMVFKKEESRTIHIKNELANLLFIDQGNILTSMGNNAIRFRSVNVKQARLKVKKVYENNLGFFLHDRTLSGNNNYYWNFQRLGAEVHNSMISIDSELNHWVENEIDVSKLLEKDKTGLYVIEISYNRNDCIGENHTSGNVQKNIMISDLALTLKKGKEAIVVATDLTTNKPAANAKIYLYNPQNQLILSGKTDFQGMFRFHLEGKKEADYQYDFWGDKDNISFSPHYMIGEYNDSKALLNEKEMQWNMSTFDVQGYDYPEKGSAYIYTERGVYRPGDTINFTMIFRNSQDTFPPNQPVLLKILDPTMTNQVKTTLTNGKDGVFHYLFETDEKAKTGTWQLHYETGGISGTTNFKIETVVAERLKVSLEPERKEMNYQQNENTIKLNAMYLFGTAASDLFAKVTASFETFRKQFTEFPGFSFYNETIDFKQPEMSVLQGRTDADGNLEKVWKLPNLKTAPCDVIAELQAEVTDKGGRASKAVEYIKIEPYKYYVGLKLSEKMITFQNGTFEIVLVDSQGKTVVGEQLEINVYQNDRYWWWEYNRQARNSHSFKQARDSKLVYSQTVTSENAPRRIDIGKIHYGKYLVEVSHKVTDGHIASQFFYPRWWGETQGGIMDIGVMQLRSDKPEYEVGEDAIIQFDAPENCRVLVSLEDSDKVRDIWWEQPNVKDGKAEIKLPLDASMIPNMYCSISVLQKVDNSNDLPIRSYGTIPLKVVDKKTVNAITITTQERIKPNSVFSVEIQTEQKRKSQVTISVVDEGLLSLTQFRTPNPWNHFFRKRLLKIKSFDTYGFVMGISKGDVFKSFSVGGDSYYEAMESKLEKRKEITDLLQKTVKRFEPVCIYSGILETDENGFLSTDFNMPQYIGAVRIMAVSVKGNTYGAGEKTVPVKDKIMVQPTLPRFASPGDEFMIPVEVFVDDEQIKEVSLHVQAEGPIIIKDEQEYQLQFAKTGSQMIDIRAQAAEEIGFATLDFEVKAGKHKNQQQVHLPVYPSQPSVYKGETKVLARGKEVQFSIPDDGYKGSMTADIQFSKLKKLNLSKRIDWLIRYPYGCLEQVTSAVFPQLYLKDLIANQKLSRSEIDENINAGIKKLRDFQLPDGSMSYWPGNRSSTHWGTNYAFHFLLQAQKLGYYVNPDFMNGIANWVGKKTTSTIPATVHEYATQTYSLYLLAVAGKPNIQSMNILYESYLPKIPSSYQWLLAASYAIVGKLDIARAIESNISQKELNQEEISIYHQKTWGSALRDESLLLMAYNHLDKKKPAFDMFHYISENISEDRWYATQTLSVSLTALGDYYLRNKDEFDSGTVRGELIFADGSKQAFQSQKMIFQLALTEQYGKEVKVRLADGTTQEHVFVTMNWTGIPILDFLPKEQNGLSLRTKFTNNSGNQIDAASIRQGDVIEMSITVKNLAGRGVRNLALVQYLPAGWEIENERLQATASFNNTKKEYDYLDIRDDKIMWFFDLPKNYDSKTFTFKIRAVTRGNFKLPSTYCEAMYHHDINATLPGKVVEVIEAK